MWLQYVENVSKENYVFFLNLQSDARKKKQDLNSVNLRKKSTF